MTDVNEFNADAPVGDDLPYHYNQLNRASLDHCVKCTICETACPVSAVTPLFSGPKYVGPQAERFRHGESVDHSLDYCSSCGICTLSCPQGVKIAELNTMARAVMKEDHMPVRDRMIAQTTLMGRAMTPVAPVANAALRFKPLRSVVQRVVGVHKDAPMPIAHTQSFEGWFRKRPARTTPASKGPVVFFHGCAGEYFEVETSKRTVEVLEHIGFEVIVPRQGCCGLAQQSNGLFEGATKSVRALCDQLRSAGRDLVVVSSSGSCAGMVKHEAHEIMGVDDPAVLDVATRMRETSEFLMELHSVGELPTDFRRLDITIPYHQPCQMKTQGIGFPAMELMKLIPGVEVIESSLPCCGIAGTYGLKKEKYDIAQAVGKPLFEFVQDTNPDLATCDTETCRWQIRQGSGAKVVHPVEVLHYAYGLSDDLLTRTRPGGK